MQKFIWLGDSWTYGYELTEEKRTTSSYPVIVSSVFDMECVNLGEVGSSIEYMLYALTKNRHLVNDGDIIFFNLTSKYRFLWIEEDGTPAVTLQLMARKKATDYKIVKESFEKYFVNEQYIDWKAVSVLNSLYLLSKELGATPVFLNIFSRTRFEDSCLIPKENWLLPQSTCIAEYILGYISNKDLVVVEDMPDLSISEWEQTKPLVEKYIKPHKQHPNELGHRKIAEELIKEIKNKELVK